MDLSHKGPLENKFDDLRELKMTDDDEFRFFFSKNSTCSIQNFQLWIFAVFLERRNFVPRTCCSLRRRQHTLHGEDICHVGLFVENSLPLLLSMGRQHVIGDEGGGEDVWWPTSQSKFSR